MFDSVFTVFVSLLSYVAKMGRKITCTCCIFLLVYTFFLSVVSGYQELASAGETPTVGSDYLLEALDDFKYDMSFTVHISQGSHSLFVCARLL